MKIYLDDIRPAPEGWELYTQAEDVIVMLLERPDRIDALSLDNDLGAGNLEGVYVAKMVCALALSGFIREIPLEAHTQNGPARCRMVDYFSAAQKAWKEQD